MKLTLNLIQHYILLENHPFHRQTPASCHQLHIKHLYEGPIIYVAHFIVCSEISIVFLQ